jgi:hypothetical protein
MNIFWLSVFIFALAIFASRAAHLSYWFLLARKRGAPCPAWSQAIGEAWMAAAGAFAALILFS